MQQARSISWIGIQYLDKLLRVWWLHFYVDLGHVVDFFLQAI
jgi:hypothetical protein